MTQTMATRIQRILVATDLSPQADLALQRAAALAVAHDAELVALHVIEPLRRDRAGGDWSWPEGVPPQRIEDEMRRNAGEELRRRLAAHAGGARVGVAEVVLGVPFVEIIRAARAMDAALIVLGAHGRHYLNDLLLGTTADRVVRKGQLPVLLVRHRPEGAYQHVLLAVDFSEPSAAAARLARDLVPQARRSYLHAYELWYEEKAYIETLSAEQQLEYRQRYEQGARQRFDAFVGENGIGDTAGRLLVRHGYPSAAIVRGVIEEHADLVAVGTRGRSGLPYVLLGSVAEHVLREASTDVLAVPLPGAHFELP